FSDLKYAPPYLRVILASPIFRPPCYEILAQIVGRQGTPYFYDSPRGYKTQISERMTRPFFRRSSACSFAIVFECLLLYSRDLLPQYIVRYSVTKRAYTTQGTKTQPKT